MKFKGMYSALFSIYDENLKVKRDSIKALMDYNRNNGIEGFYVGGSTGECFVLPNHTRIQMLETAMENKKDSKIIAHIGANNFTDTKELLIHADKLNVDAIASLPPALRDFYNEEETINYYNFLASMTEKPVIAYIQSFYSGNVLNLAKKLMEIPNVIGIKLTVPSYYLFEQIRRSFTDINLLNGPDESALAGLISGADGAIGTTYNLLPAAASNLYNSFIKNDIETAKENQHKLNSFIDVLLGGKRPTWKEPLRYIDIDPGYTVFPALPLNDFEKTELKKKAIDCGAYFEMTK